MTIVYMNVLIFGSEITRKTILFNITILHFDDLFTILHKTTGVLALRLSKWPTVIWTPYLWAFAESFPGKGKVWKQMNYDRIFLCFVAFIPWFAFGPNTSFVCSYWTIFRTFLDPRSFLGIKSVLIIILTQINEKIISI